MTDDYYFNFAICLSGVCSALVWYVEKMIMVVVGLVMSHHLTPRPTEYDATPGGALSALSVNQHRTSQSVLYSQPHY